VAPRYRPLGFKIEVHDKTVNGESSSMSLTLVLAVLSLAVWAILAFGVALHSGAVHLLLALGTALLVRWWALRA
jgi:hypothetical protein